MIAQAAANAQAATAARVSAQVAAGKCSEAGCTGPLFAAGLCFDHNRLHKIKQSSGAASSAKAPPAIATANKATIRELVGSVDRQPSFGRMVGYSLECLKKLAVDAVAVEEILEQGTIQSLEAAMALHPDNAQLHKQYMECLAVFAQNGRLAHRVGEQMNNNYTKFAHSLRTHNNVDTHIATARAMAALAEDPANMDRMADQGCLDALAEAVKQNPDNADLLAAAAKVFSRFAGHKAEYADYITNSGATEVIIAKMRANPEHLELAKNGAEMLAVLAGSSNTNCETLKKQGAVDALLAALEAHPYDKQLESYATRALALLTGEDDMLAALSVCHGDMAMDLATAKALSTVASLLLVGANVEALFRHKGVDWLMSVLAVAEGVLDEAGNKILTAGLRALTRSATDPNRIYDLIKHGAVQLLVALLNNRTDGDVLAASLGLLAKLVANSAGNAVYVANHGGINAALRAFALHGESASVVDPTLDFLCAMTCFDGVTDALVQAGTIEALLDMLRRNMANTGIVVGSITALGRLATSEGHVRRMAEGGLLGLLVEALRKHVDSEAAVRTALLALETAALLPENIKELLRLGAVPAIHAAMGRWPGNADIQAIGARALALLLQAQQAELDRARLEALERARREEEDRLRREAEERRRLEAEMAEALARLKLQDEEEAAAKRRAQQKVWEDDIKLKAMRAAEAENDRLAALVDKKPAAPVAAAPVVRKSARAIFEAEDDDEKPVFELDPATRQFLLSGQMLTKHSKTALPAARHLYLTQDLHHLIWNKPMTPIQAKNTMLATSVYAAVRGQTTPQLQRVRFGTKLAGAAEHCFSIFGLTEEGVERTVDFECKSLRERERWIEAIEQLIRWIRTKKLYGERTMEMQSADKILKQQAKEQRRAAREAAGSPQQATPSSSPPK